MNTKEQPIYAVYAWLYQSTQPTKTLTFDSKFSAEAFKKKLQDTGMFAKVYLTEQESK